MNDLLDSSGNVSIPAAINPPKVFHTFSNFLIAKFVQASD